MLVNLESWNDFLTHHPNVHLLQNGMWGELKSGFGWKAVRVINGDSGVQILFRSLPGGFSIGYIPKGPIGSINALMPELDKICKEHRAVFLKIEPDIWEPEEMPELSKEAGWQYSNSIQPRRTVLIPLDKSEDDILDNMKQKTRYNIRLGEKKGLSVRESVEVDKFFRMAQITGKRDGFAVHSLAYYQKAHKLFNSNGQVELLFTYFEDRAIAGLMLFYQGKNAWYMYGASTDEERNRMPTYILQWEAIKRAKSHGCEGYDLWGVPDHEGEKLEEDFSGKHSHEGLWGVYRFKRGFGGELKRSVGAWDKVYYPGLYKIYKQIMHLRGNQDI